MITLKKLCISTILFFALSGVFAAPPETTYISPNNDGIQDELTFKISIADKRYISEWSFVIENEEKVPVRTIANKDKRPDPPTGFISWITSFWKRLTSPKKGVEIPETLRWDGIFDSGEIAPDGTYYYYITASDDNGNMAKTPPLTVVVDNTFPIINLKQFESQDMLIISPDGDGNKDTITFTQSGSVEDLWEGIIKDASGNIVRTFTWENSSPKSPTWDGKTDLGTIAPDSVYSYNISVTDRAGNKISDQIDNIILNTDKPSINISIGDSFFSPNGDMVKDTVKLIPSAPVTSGLTRWDISIIDNNEKVLRTYFGEGKTPASIDFDGKNDDGILLEEGTYQAVFTTSYVNGYSPTSRSPFFRLDITPPSAVIRAGTDIFSPNGDGIMDTIQIFQEASQEPLWTGTIFDEQDKVVRTYSFAQTIPAFITWDGMTDAKVLAPDGTYKYQIKSTDRAGNGGTSNIITFKLDTEGTDVILTGNQIAFSPNTNSKQNSITFTPIVKTGGVQNYTLSIVDETDTVIKTFTGNDKVPPSISWNGLSDTGIRANDGAYTAVLEVLSRNGTTASSTTPAFTIDTALPTVEVSAPWLLFSPNEDGKKDTLPIKINSSSENLWTGIIQDTKGNVVRTVTWEGKAQDFNWDASDDAGNIVTDGEYKFIISCTDIAGNYTEAVLAGIKIDARVPKAFLTSSQSAISPNGDGVKDEQRFSILTTIKEGIESWHVVIVPEHGKTPVKQWSTKDMSSLPANITWDGKGDNGNIAEGRFTAVLEITYTKGDVLTIATPTFVSTVTPPQLTVRMTPRYFSPDNDGVDDDLFISLKAVTLANITSWSFDVTAPNKTAFWKTSGSNSITERLIWDGRSNKGELVQAATDYPFTFTVTDDLGMSSTVTGIIPVDVLVIRVGNILKIQVPSILFRENAADFIGLPSDVVEKNTTVLKRVSEILNKFKDYKITVEGHANNVTGTEKEEIQELVPLSELRANAVRNILIKNGVDASRLSSVGRGGRQPVAARSDRDNWWKNRRVEFILEK